MFIEDEELKASIVYGANTGLADSDALGDILSSIAAATKETPDAKPVVTNGFAIKFEEGLNKLNLGETLGDVLPYIDEDIFPILQSGEFITKESAYRYEQKSRFGLGTLVHFADNDFKNKKPTIGIKFETSEQVFNHTIDFIKAAETDIEIPSLRLLDFEEARFCRLGICFEMLPKSQNASPNLVMAMVAGAVEDTLEENEEKTYTLPDAKRYNVKVDFISNPGAKAIFIVNGEKSRPLSADEDYTFSGGIRISPREFLITEKEQSINKVRFYFGSLTTTMKANGDIVINGETIEELDGFGEGNLVDTSPLRISLEELGLIWTTEDKVYVAEEIEAVLPGMKTLKLFMDGFHEGKKEYTEFTPRGKYRFAINAPLVNYDVELEVLYDSDRDGDWDVVGGDEEERLLTQTAGENFTYDKDTDKWFVISMIDGKKSESHVLEVTSIKGEDGVSISDFSGKELFTDKRTRDMLKIGNMTLSILGFNSQGNNVTFKITSSNAVNNTLITKEGMKITLPIGYGNGTITDSSSTSLQPSSVLFELKAEDDQENIGQGVHTTSFKASFNARDEATITDLNQSVMSGGKIFETETDKIFVGYVEEAVSTKVHLDKTENFNRLGVWYPGEETYGNVYWGTAGAKIVRTNILPITDEMITSYTDKNLIIIGGPCANKAAAAVMNVSMTQPECSKGFSPGEGKILLYDHGNGNSALVIAGYDAVDTRKASIVAANFLSYPLTGDKVTIAGESFFDIKLIT